MLFITILSILVTLKFTTGYTNLLDEQIKSIAKNYPPADYLRRDDKKGLLEPILKVRLPGTENSTLVRKHFDEFFKSLNKDWKITHDSFTDDTPIQKNMSFTNFIATRDPPNKKDGNVGRLVLAAHYDSKLTPEGFIGAIDSAFPCAAAMYVAKALDDALTKKWKHEKNGANMGLQIIFFDGEEAFENWTDKDSIYGARHLAKKMENTVTGTNSIRKNNLDAIDTLVLLDLLGTPDPQIPSYFRDTDWLHQNLGDVHTRLQHLDLAQNKTYFPSDDFFAYGGRIGDDHLPFLHRGVPILHLIPTPFPDVWHKIDDNADCLDDKTMDDWAMIMTTFTAEYFDLNKYISKSSVSSTAHRDML